MDDETWDVRYLAIDTRTWRPGRHVLMSPHAVRSVSWSGHDIALDVARDQVKAGPPWTPVDLVDQPYRERLHAHHGWPGYGW